MTSKHIFIILIWPLLFAQSCRSMNVNPSNDIIVQKECNFNKEWLEQHFDAKNILKIDSEYNNTLFIIFFKKAHRDDAENLLDGFQKISVDVSMTETASFFQIYLSKKTIDEICQLKRE